MENTTLLHEYSPAEKTAYLQAIASLATADRSASPDEIEYLSALSREAGLSAAETNAILKSAKESREDSLAISLNVLKGSNLGSHSSRNLFVSPSQIMNIQLRKRLMLKKLLPILTLIRRSTRLWETLLKNQKSTRSQVTRDRYQTL